MSVYLLRYIDPDLEIKDGESIESLGREESQRLGHMLIIATTAGQIARRLGPDATDEELAEDKKRAHRIAHVARNCLIFWGSSKGAYYGNREAATVNWERWWGEHNVWLQNRMRYIATWSFKTNGANDRWAKSALVRLENEQKWLEYAMR